MHFLHFLYISCFSIALCGQNIPIGIGTSWMYEQFELGTQKEDFYLFSVDRDTVVNEEIFYNVSERYLIRTVDGIDTSLVQTHLLQFEDQQIRYYDPPTDSILLLYDFSLEPGDEFDMALGPYHIPEVPQSTTSILVKEAMIFTSPDFMYQDYMSNDELYYVGLVVKGIGGTTYFFPTQGLSDPFRGGLLVCFENGEDYFPSQANCDLVLNNQKIGKQSSNIYPNPASNNLYIESESKLRTVHFYDIQGYKVAQFYNSNNIDLTSLPMGMYILKAYTASGEMIVKKLIIARR